MPLATRLALAEQEAERPKVLLLAANPPGDYGGVDVQPVKTQAEGNNATPLIEDGGAIEMVTSKCSSTTSTIPARASIRAPAWDLPETRTSASSRYQRAVITSCL